MAPQQDTSKTAIAALILGIISIVIGWIPIIGWTIILLAIILGGVGISETKTRPGRWMAVTGLVLGIISIIIMVAALAALLLFATTTSMDSYQAGEAIERVERVSGADGTEMAVRVIDIEGMGLNRTIQSEEPIELTIAGIGNTIRVEDALIATAIIDGMDNTLIIGENASLHETIDAGVNTQIIEE